MFEKGHKKIGGRKKGSINKIKTTVREAVETALNGSLPEILIDQYSLMSDPEAKVKLLLELMPYCYPKLSSQDVSMELNAEVEANTSSEIKTDIDNYKQQIRAQIECEMMMEAQQRKKGNI